MNQTGAISCLLIGYSRPEKLKSQLDLLFKGNISRIYIAIDGQKTANPEITRNFETVIQNYMIKNSVEIKCWFRDKNLGTAVSIITGLDWFFKFEESGVILEDDVLPSDDFFRFMEKSLNEVRFDDSVWLVSGNQFFPTNFESSKNIWANYPLIWGWGTHKEKWLRMREAILNDAIIFDVEVTPKVRNYWKTGFLRTRQSRVDSWAIPLAAQMRARNKYCLLPTVNLVTNVGIDRVASNTKLHFWTINLPTSTLPDYDWIQLSKRDIIAKEMNLLLENQVYGIKTRHRFLFLIENVLNYFKSDIPNEQGQLIARVLGVSIPDA